MSQIGQFCLKSYTWLKGRCMPINPSSTTEYETYASLIQVWCHWLIDICTGKFSHSLRDSLTLTQTLLFPVYGNILDQYLSLASPLLRRDKDGLWTSQVLNGFSTPSVFSRTNTQILPATRRQWKLLNWQILGEMLRLETGRDFLLFRISEKN